MIENRKRVLAFFCDTALLVACCVFFVSIIQPFLAFGYVSPFRGESWSVDCWSYQGVLLNEFLSFTKSFSDYWLNGGNAGFPMISLGPDILIFLFLAQLSTLTTGLVSFIPGKRRAAILPFVLSMVVTLAMIQASRTFALNYLGYFTSLGGGYWLTYPSTFMFLISFTLDFRLHSDSGTRKEWLKNTKRYWKHHRLDESLIAISLLAAAYTASQVAATLLDPMFHMLILQGSAPLGGTVVPYRNPQLHWRNDFDMLHVISTEPISLSNWLGLLSPLLIILPTIGIEYIRYHLWKKKTDQNASISSSKP